VFTDEEATMVRITGRLSYANVVSTLALFAAVGGTSYALTLPKNSVGRQQLRTGAVGASELRRGAVRSLDIHDHSITSADLTRRATQRLRGKAGPAGPPGPRGISYFLVANSAGGVVAGNGGVTSHEDINGYVVTFPRSVAGCALVASPARVPGGAVTDPPPGASVIVGHEGDNALVKTFDENRQPKGLPFALIAAC
jgi:hypothetical protein